MDNPKEELVRFLFHMNPGAWSARDNEIELEALGHSLDHSEWLVSLETKNEHTINLISGERVDGLRIAVYHEDKEPVVRHFQDPNEQPEADEAVMFLTEATEMGEPHHW